MENFMKNHTALRMVLIFAFFAAGIALVIGGWFMHGSGVGLMIMLLGTVFLLTSLFVYNALYKDPKKK